jgi:hypothetical protein
MKQSVLIAMNNVSINNGVLDINRMGLQDHDLEGIEFHPNFDKVLNVNL